MNALKCHWCETGLLSQAVLKHVVCKDSSSKSLCKGPVLYPAKNEESMALFRHAKNFSSHVTLLLKRKHQHLGHK